MPSRAAGRVGLAGGRLAPAGVLLLLAATAVAAAVVARPASAHAACDGWTACPASSVACTVPDCDTRAASASRDGVSGEEPGPAGSSPAVCGVSCDDPISDAPLPLGGHDPWWLLAAWTALAIAFPGYVVWQRKRRTLAGPRARLSLVERRDEQRR